MRTIILLIAVFLVLTILLITVINIFMFSTTKTNPLLALYLLFFALIIYIASAFIIARIGIRLLSKTK